MRLPNLMKEFTDIHTGLTSAQVEENRRKYGSNEMTPPSRDPWWVELARKFADPLIVILIAAAVISFIPVILSPGEHSPIESIGIMCAVLLATTVGFVNEYRANKEFDILNKVNDVTPVRVLRDGKHTMVPKNDFSAHLRRDSRNTAATEPLGAFQAASLLLPLCQAENRKY